jgi:CHAD domain-containing protein
MRKTDLAFASKTLHHRVDVFCRRLSKVVSGISDRAVHDTRVESRRMRAALEAFGALFPPNPLSLVLRDVRRITRLLGKPRETAVCIDLMHELEDQAKTEPSCRKVLDTRLSSRLKKQAIRLQKKIQRIDPIRIRSRLDFLLSVMEPDATDGTDASRGHPVQQRLVFAGRESAVFQAARILSTAFSPVLRYHAEKFFDTATDEELHGLRIAAKKARYAMEIYSPIWPGGLEEHIATARRFQDAAGSYHDWGVLCQHLSKEAARLEPRNPPLLLSEIGRLAACTVSRQAGLRPILRDALLELQDQFAALERTIRLLAAHSNMQVSKNSPLLTAVEKSKWQRAGSVFPARKAVASR